MTIGAFNSSLVLVEKILKESNLFKQKGVKPIGEISQEFKNTSIKGSYFDTYKVGIKNLDYDFLLNDDSFFQFVFIPNSQNLPSIRYAFFQNPQEFISYEEYLFSEEVSYEEVGDSLLEYYQQFLTEAEINSNSSTLRYDLDHLNHSPLIHATSHLHIGKGENVRIPCDKIMSPLSFAMFVIKHVYYNNWKQLISDTQWFQNNYLNTLKSSCTNVIMPYWVVNPEAKEFFLT